MNPLYLSVVEIKRFSLADSTDLYICSFFIAK